MKNLYHRLIFTVIILILVSTFSPIQTNAHPGRTASDRCHYCRTNCSSWGVQWDARHCHNGSSSYTKSATNHDSNDFGSFWVWIIILGWIGSFFFFGSRDK